MVPKVKLWSRQLDAAITERHRYAAYVAFQAVLGWEFEWCTQEELRANENTVCIQYGGLQSEAPKGVEWIPDSGLLNAKGVQDIALDWSDASLSPGAIRLPFGVKDEETGGVDSDWLSWVFWMASRMEEQVEHQEAFRDDLGRFKGSQSLAHQEGWLPYPIVEKCIRIWAKNSTVSMPLQQKYSVEPTIDVDSAYAYRHKGWKLTLAASANDLIRGRWLRLIERPLVLLGWRADPYDTYAWLEKAHENVALRARYFFLLSDRGRYDRGVPWYASQLRTCIQSLRQSAAIGIHPGFASHDAADDASMHHEIERLAGVLNERVVVSRQHYLLQRFPESWKRLERLGITSDHSLGYADVVGFRAGMSRPFRAYDITEERIMDIVLHPIAVMDATLMRHLKLSPKEALERVRQLSSHVKEVEGVMVLLWHNESVSDRWEWQGWMGFYQEVLEAVVLDKNGITLDS